MIKSILSVILLSTMLALTSCRMPSEEERLKNLANTGVVIEVEHENFRYTIWYHQGDRAESAVLLHKEEIK